MTNFELAAAAWEAVRKGDDAPWNVLPIGIKAKLSDLAGKYRNGARVAEGDYPPEGFAEKCVELGSRQEFFTVGDGDGSEPELVSDGVGEVQTAEHEDTHVPSPNPEDVDPLKTNLAEPQTPNRRSVVPDRRGSFRGGKLDPRPDTTVERREGVADRRDLNPIIK